MSYALRNTIILLVTLFLFVGSGYSYIKFVQEAKIDELTSSANNKRADLTSKQQISASYPELKSRYELASQILLDYDKRLYSSDNPDDAFDYIDDLSSGSALVYFDYVFQDSVTQEQYGIITSSINGFGNYENLYRFIYRIENSQMINKITSVSVSPPSGQDVEEGEVQFTMGIDSYYNRVMQQEPLSVMEREPVADQARVYNPFLPLISESIPENTENLVDIENSRVIGITANRIFIVDQTGKIQSLRTGDKVYLGTLQNVDVPSRKATFRLNKGGIIELVTLEIER